MSERLSIGQLYPGVAAPPPSRKSNRNSNPAGVSFDEVLQNQTGAVRFSHHAEERLKQRGIRFQPDQLEKLTSAIDKAATKGAKDSLMLLNGTALIVNIKNRTVVTAMDGTSMKDNLFTQIDSAMIIS